jgi:hypothetical protein
MNVHIAACYVDVANMAGGISANDVAVGGANLAAWQAAP